MQMIAATVARWFKEHVTQKGRDAIPHRERRILVRLMAGTVGDITARKAKRMIANGFKAKEQ